MKKISDEEYEQFQILKQNAESQANFDSVRETKYLENDIDTPIRKLVAMFALLGCEPQFSCCGFDYDGQPLHKTHEYGCVYFILDDNSETEEVIQILMDRNIVVEDDGKTDKWTTWKNAGGVILRTAFTKKHDSMDYPWVAKRTCIHYSEVAALNISVLERALRSLSDWFAPVVTLYDTNTEYRNRRKVSEWQYPGLEPWTIYLDDLEL